MPQSKRGAPPGNLNALKHGFYSSKIRKASDCADVAAHNFTGLAEEISLLRIYIRRVIQQSEDYNGDLEVSLIILRALCLANASLARLIKVQHFLGSNDNEWVNIAIREDYQALCGPLDAEDSSKSGPPAPSSTP